MADAGLTAIRESFAVPAPPDVVWRALHDSTLVARCVPGVNLTAVHEDGRHEGTIRVRFGPTQVEFGGEANVAYDDASRICTITSRGRDKRATSTARAEGRISLSGDQETTVDVEGGFQVSGALGSFARTGGVFLARELIAQFAANLARQLQATAQPASDASAPAADTALAPTAPASNTMNLGALLWSAFRAWLARLGRGPAA